MPSLTRYHCPLSACEWAHDAPDLADWDPPADRPSAGPTAAPKTVEEALHAAAYATLLEYYTAQESVIREHLETHTLLEWVTEVMRLRNDLAPLGALAPTAADRLELGDDPEFFVPGRTYLSANGWFRFDCHVVAAGVALGVEEQVKWLHRPVLTEHRVWKSVKPVGSWVDVTGPVAAMDRFGGAVGRLVHDPGVGEEECRAVAAQFDARFTVPVAGWYQVGLGGSLPDSPEDSTTMVAFDAVPVGAGSVPVAHRPVTLASAAAKGEWTVSLTGPVPDGSWIRIGPPEGPWERVPVYQCLGEGPYGAFLGVPDASQPDGVLHVRLGLDHPAGTVVEVTDA